MSRRVARELALLPESDLRTVRLLYALGGRPSELARLLGVAPDTIRAILRPPAARRAAQR
ncbi:MAG TPA: hypothetical protein VFF06_22405 [Polyangia bacterium]|nr:hypothetical protein [Polyangia bacterium]